MKKNIQLNLRIPPERAAHIVGWLYGAGVISKDKYRWHMERIDAERLAAESDRNEKLNKKLGNIRTFYKKKPKVHSGKTGV